MPTITLIGLAQQPGTEMYHFAVPAAACESPLASPSCQHCTAIVWDFGQSDRGEIVSQSSFIFYISLIMCERGCMSSHIIKGHL